MFNLFTRSKTAVAVSIVCSSMLLTGCGGNSKSTPPVVVEPEPPQSLFADVQGFWHKKGYGEFVHIGENSLEMYEFNEFGCIKTDSVDHQQGEALVDEIKKTDAGNLSVLVKNNLRADVYHSAASLPESCHEPIELSANTNPEVVFDYFWHTFNDYYAFFEARGVNWQQTYEQYRSQVTAQTTEEQLFDILASMITPLRDGHSSISSEDDDFSIGKTIPMESSMFATIATLHRGGQNASFEDIEAWFYQRYIEIQKGYVTEQSLGVYPSHSPMPTLLWGKTPNNVGLLVVNDMFNFAADGEQVGEHGIKGIVEAAQEQMDIVMEQLKDTDGLILDIRINGGGADDISLAIAQYFADQDVTVFHKQAVNRTGQGQAYEVKLTANENAYTKPVYLLTSQKTASAAEIFTMAMKPLEHVIQVGEETSGALSDVLSLKLPNGWGMSMSNEVYKDGQGLVHEVSGLTPDIPAWAYTYESMDSGRFETYEAALKQLGKWQKPQLSQQSFETQVAQIMSQSHIPGVAVAIVKDDEVAYSQGFGRADENGRPVTVDTPFFLASVSKTILGTLMAQAESDNIIAINEPVAPLLSFSIDYPNSEDFSPTFRHLVTHTSGIIDEKNAFFCNYFLLADNSSLFELVDDSISCDDYIENDMGMYLARYLQVGGDYYRQENFTASMDVAPGEIHYYSNFATALAGYALEKKSGRPLPDLTHEYVFGPLQMNRSVWSIEGQPTDLATRYYYDEDLGKPQPIPDYNAVVYPDGGAISSAADMAKYMVAVMNNGVYQDQQVLNSQAVEKMLSNQSEAANTERGVGYFWRLDGDYFSHNGGDPGVRTQIWADTNAGVGIVLLTNAPALDHEDAEEGFEQINALLKTFARSL